MPIYNFVENNNKLIYQYMNISFMEVNENMKYLPRAIFKGSDFGN
jgi:hypothetical protein